MREPIEDLKLVESDPANIRLLKVQTEDEQLLAVNNDPSSIQYIDEPLDSVMKAAIDLDPSSIQHFYNKASKEIRMLALQLDPKTIQYLPDSTRAEQLYVIEQNDEILPLIKNRDNITDIIYVLIYLKFVIPIVAML